MNRTYEKTYSCLFLFKVKFHSSLIPIFSFLPQGLFPQPHDVRDGAGPAVLHHDPEVRVLKVGTVVLDHVGRVALLHNGDLLDNLLEVCVHGNLAHAVPVRHIH